MSNIITRHVPWDSQFIISTLPTSNLMNGHAWGCKLRYKAN